MPVRRNDAHRALELLEVYKDRVDDDEELRAAIERVIKVFKSRLFLALLDIQEFYESTLLDERKSNFEKTKEAIELGRKLDPTHVPKTAATTNGYGTSERQQQQPVALTSPPQRAEKENIQPIQQQQQQIPRQPQPQPPPTNSNNTYQQIAAVRPTTSQPIPPPQQQQQQFAPIEQQAPVASSIDDADWEYDSVTLNRGDGGLGFSIAGGNDNHHIDGDPSIFITKVIEGGASDRSGHVFLNDAIVSVNGIDLSNITHQEAVEVLRNAGDFIHLELRRQFVEEVVEIVLYKGSRGLGFSIAGGVDNQHIAGDNGIFVTRVIEGAAAHADGRLSVGDHLIAVNGFELENVSHEEAVNVLKSCGDKVVLVVGKSPYPIEEDGDLSGGGGNAPSLQFASPQNQSFQSNDFPAPPPPPTQVQIPQTQQQPKPLQPTPPIVAAKPSKPPPMVPPKPPPSTAASLSDSARHVQIRRGENGFGFNIIGGDSGEGIFISFIVAGGPGDMARLRKGDKILSVNGRDMLQASHEDAAQMLKSCRDMADIVVQFLPQDFEEFEVRISGGAPAATPMPVSTRETPTGTWRAAAKPKPFFVKALFTYEPAKDTNLPGRGLEFRFADILNVTNSADEDWWQARRLAADGSADGSVGIIPSRLRMERHERHRLKKVIFNEKELGQTGSLGRSAGKGKKFNMFPKSKSKDEQSDEDHVTGTESEREGLSGEMILTYEMVERRECTLTRPIIVFGPLKDRMHDDLLMEMPERFMSCVPHTSRPRRDNEEHGRDYFFITRAEMERDIKNNLFIEAGQYNDHLYGTSVEAVINIAKMGRHCILDVSGNAIKRLVANSIHPIVIFIKPSSPEQIKRWNHRIEAEQADKLYERAMKLETDFSSYFTAIVQGNDVDELYLKVKEVIDDYARSKCIWIANGERVPP